MVNRKAERKNMEKLNKSIRQANRELDRVMHEFLEKFKKVQELVAKNSKDNPVVIGTPEDKLFRECYNQWLDMILAYPLIKFREPKLFYDINDLFFGDQPPVGEVKKEISMPKKEFYVEYGDKETDFVIPKKSNSGITAESVLKDTFGSGKDCTLPDGNVIKVYDIHNEDGTVRTGNIGEKFFLTIDSAEGTQLYVIHGEYISERLVTLSAHKNIPTGTFTENGNNE